MGTTGILLYERSFARHCRMEVAGLRYTVRVLDYIDGLELQITPELEGEIAPLAIKLTGDEARDLADALERAANRVYPLPREEPESN